MGREIKRVAMDFNWPLDEVYGGYLMSDDLEPVSCSCELGYSEDGYRYHQEWYGQGRAFNPLARGQTLWTPDNVPGLYEHIERKLRFDSDGVKGSSMRFYMQYSGSLTEDQAIRREMQRMCDLWNQQWGCHLTQDEVDWALANHRYKPFRDLTQKFVQGEGWVDIERDTPLTAQEVNLFQMLSPMAGSGNMGAAMAARAHFEGTELSCSICEGEGHTFRDEAHKAAYDGWERTEPPAGEGYQMWETTTEGSPQSPVFATPEELARWLADTGASSFGSSTASYETWLKFIVGDAWAPSMVIQNGQIMSGVEFAAENN